MQPWEPLAKAAGGAFIGAMPGLVKSLLHRKTPMGTFKKSVPEEEDEEDAPHPKIASVEKVTAAPVSKPAYVPPQCKQNNSQDEGAPVPTVMSRHRDTLGFCHFGYLNDNLGVCAANMLGGHYNFKAQDYFGYHVRNDLPKRDVTYDGGHFKTTMNWETNKESIFDDLYCHANGWLMNQRLPAAEIEDAKVWEGLATLECEKIAAQGFSPQELTIASMKFLQTQQTRALAAQEGGASAPMPTRRDMQRHAAVKCALGGVGCDMAACMKLGCLQQDGYIARGGMCNFEGPPQPMQLPSESESDN